MPSDDHIPFVSPTARMESEPRFSGKTKANGWVTGENKSVCLHFCDLLPFAVFSPLAGRNLGLRWMETAFWKVQHTWRGLLLLCLARAGESTTKARPLQGVSSTEVQQHKQLIKLRWRRQESWRPCGALLSHYKGGRLRQAD